MTTVLDTPAIPAAQTWESTRVQLGTVSVLVEHPDPVGVRITLTAPTGQTAEFTSVSDLASAVHLSGVVLSREMTDARVAEVILLGCQYAGMDGIRQHGQADRQANGDGLAGRITAREWSRSRRQLWDTARRAQLCADLAARVGMWAPARARGEG